MDKETITILRFLGRNLKKLRAGKGVSLEAVSNAVGMELELIYRIEKGEYNLILDEFHRLSVYFGESPADLLRKKY